MREAFFPTAVQHYAVETARPDDWDAIAAITARHGRTTTCAPWWDAVPHAFRVARNPRGIVVAFTILCPLEDVPRGAASCEPLARAPARAPGAEGPARALGAARARHGTGAAPSPCFSALLRDVERASLETPAVRRIYTAAGDRGAARAARLPPARRRRDWSATSARSPSPGWLSMLAARGLDVAPTALGDERASSRSKAERSRSPSSSPTSCATCTTAKARPSPAPPCCATSGATSGPGRQRRRRRDLRPAPQARRPRARRSPPSAASASASRAGHHGRLLLCALLALLFTLLMAAPPPRRVGRRRPRSTPPTQPPKRA